MGAAFGIDPPMQEARLFCTLYIDHEPEISIILKIEFLVPLLHNQVDVDIATHIYIYDDGPDRRYIMLLIQYPSSHVLF